MEREKALLGPGRTNRGLVGGGGGLALARWATFRGNILVLGPDPCEGWLYIRRPALGMKVAFF